MVPRHPLPEAERHPLSIVDDHSRYAVGLYALPRLSAEGAWACLVETFRRYGVPQAMLMGRGTLWWSEHNGWGLTRLSVRLIEQGIRLSYGRICHPQTQGKVERFHRTLGMRRPAEVYQPSPRTYQEQPREWEYPAGSEVRRLNRNGLLREGGRQWFECEALGGHRVRIEYVDRKMLVSYRHMYIREIDPEKGRTRPLVVERREASAATGSWDPPVALRAPSGSQDPQNQA
jgi:transposase InsO family protein